MENHNTSSIVGANDKDNNFVLIWSAKRENEYTCIKCLEGFDVVQGEVNAWHFRHKKDSNCQGSQETALHIHAKQIIFGMDYITMPTTTYKGRELHRTTRLKFKDSIIEPSKSQRDDNGNYRPDLIATLRDGRALWIEVTVTSKTDGKKLQYIKDNSIIAIEFDLSTIQRNISPFNLRVLLNDAQKKVRYLNVPGDDDRKKKIDDFIESERAKFLIENEALKKIEDVKMRSATLGMYKLRDKEQQRILEGNKTQYNQAISNHNNWVHRQQKNNQPYYTFDELMKTNWLDKLD